MTDRPVILIIDDNAVIHRLLTSMLAKAHYDVRDAFDGQSGLKLAREAKPNVILLDVTMPEMDGFDVVRHLKTDPVTCDIPVIFLSSRTDSADRVRGLQLGAADYVSKPVDQAELIVRIRTQIRLRRQEEALREYSQNLERMVEERTRQLIHSDRLVSLGKLSADIAHEINNPTTYITGNIKTLRTFWDKASGYLETHPQAETDPTIGYILKELPGILDSIHHGASRITGIIHGLRTFSRNDAPTKAQTPVRTCLSEALELTQNRLKHRVRVEQHIEEDLPDVWANAQQLVQVFVNLIVNAADAIGDGNGLLTINGRVDSMGRVELTFSDSGPGMTSDVMTKVFDPFFTTKPVGEGTGLGLSISHGIITDHQGTIDVTSRLGQGSIFVVTLPSAEQFRR